MAETTERTDKGVGLTLILSALAIIGAAVMLVGAPAEIAGYGFAAAVGFAAIAVVAIHLYWSA